jgi:hypothetical protein
MEISDGDCDGLYNFSKVLGYVSLSESSFSLIAFSYAVCCESILFKYKLLFYLDIVNNCKRSQARVRESIDESTAERTQ